MCTENKTLFVENATQGCPHMFDYKVILAEVQKHHSNDHLYSKMATKGQNEMNVFLFHLHILGHHLLQ